MADYILDVLNQTSKLDWAFPFQRTGAFPLDRSSLFDSYDDAVLYAQGGADKRGLSGSSYVGQIITVFDAINNEVIPYSIQPNRELKKLNSSKEFESALKLLEQEIAKKANSADVYTKTETDLAIETAVAQADHLQRKIVNSYNSIDPEAIDAHLYIYMVPNGLQADDDKYDEYVVINNTIEKVGSWEVDLSDYATKNELKTLSTALNDLSEDVSDNKNAITEIDKDINELSNNLNTKVDKVYYNVPVLDENGNPSYDDNGQVITQQVVGTLLSPDDRKKLDSLVIGDDGVEISGKVNAANVEGLDTWLTQNGATYISNLTENNLSQAVIDKLNFITSVDNQNFLVSNGELKFKEVAISQVKNLQETLDSKVTAVEGSRLINNNEILLLQDLANGKYNNFITSVESNTFEVSNGMLNLISIPVGVLNNTLGDLNTLPNANKNFNLVDEINNIYELLTWADIPE